MRHPAFCLALLLAALAAGCGRSLDRTQLDQCRRVAEALQPRDTALRELRVSPAEGGVRIDFIASEPGSRVRYVRCSFATRADALGRSELTGVETEEGALGEARLLFLNRFVLEAGRAAPAIVSEHVPQVPVAVAYAAQQLVSALALASIYGLLACAYALIYGLIGRINLAFGDIAVLGGYAAIGGVAAALASSAGAAAGLLLALALATIGGALWSAAIGSFVIAPLHRRFRAGQPILVATVAVAICLQEFLRLFQGARERWVPPILNDPIALLRAEGFAVTVTPMQLLVVLVASGAAGALLLLMARTALGRQWRAYADDPLAATLLGVSPARVMGASFLLAGLNAGLAGWMLAVHYGNVSYGMGTMLSLKALLAAIAGGIGRIGGALLGGLLIGLLEAGWSAYFDIASRDIAVFALLIALFVLRPGGLLGSGAPRLREI